MNAEVADQVEAAAKKIQKLAPTDEKQRKTVDEALEELKEGASAIAERQKHIRIADQSKYYWQTVEAYKSGVGIADNEEDAKKLKQAEKSAEQGALKEKQRAAAAAALAKQNGFLHRRPCHLYHGPQPSHRDTSLGCHRKNGPGKNGPAGPILHKKLSSRTVFGRPNLVRPDKVSQPETVRLDQKWSGLEIR